MGRIEGDLKNGYKKYYDCESDYDYDYDYDCDYDTPYHYDDEYNLSENDPDYEGSISEAIDNMYDK